MLLISKSILKFYARLALLIATTFEEPVPAVPVAANPYANPFTASESNYNFH